MHLWFWVIMNSNWIQNLVAGNSIPDEFVPFIPWLRTLRSFSNLKLSALCMPLGTFHPLTSSSKFLLRMIYLLKKHGKESMYKRASQSILSGIKIIIPKDLKLVDRFAIPGQKGD